MRILGFIIFIPTIFACIIFLFVYWINSFILIPFKIYNYGIKKGLKSWLMNNILFTEEVFNNF